MNNTLTYKKPTFRENVELFVDEAIEKLKKVQHRGYVDRNDLVKVGHGKLDVAGLIGEEVDLDEASPNNHKSDENDMKKGKNRKKSGKR